MDHFEIGEVLGKDDFGKIFLATEKRSKCTVGLKKIYRQQVHKNSRDCQLRREIENHSQLRHRCILCLYCYFGDQDHLYMALEYADQNGGGVYKKLNQAGPFDETRAAKVDSCFCLGLCVCVWWGQKFEHGILKF